MSRRSFDDSAAGSRGERRSSDHRGCMVEQLDELDETLAVRAVHVPPGMSAHACGIRDHSHHRSVLRRREPAADRATSLDIRRECGHPDEVQGFAVRKRVQNPLAPRERRLVRGGRGASESGSALRLPVPGLGNAVCDVGAVESVPRSDAAVRIGDFPSPVRRWCRLVLDKSQDSTRMLAEGDRRGAACRGPSVVGCLPRLRIGAGSGSASPEIFFPIGSGRDVPDVSRPPLDQRIVVVPGVDDRVGNDDGFPVVFVPAGVNGEQVVERNIHIERSGELLRIVAGGRPPERASLEWHGLVVEVRARFGGGPLVSMDSRWSSVGGPLRTFVPGGRWTMSLSAGRHADARAPGAPWLDRRLERGRSWLLQVPRVASATGSGAA